MRKRSSRKLPFLILIAVGALAGWLYANPRNQDRFIEFVGELSNDLPGTVQRTLDHLKHLPPPDQWKTVLGRAGIASLRLYDRFMPQDFRDTLADGLPSVFAYPYLCKLTRVFKKDLAPGVNPTLPARINGQETRLPQDALIRPGTELLGSAEDMGAEIDCRRAKLVLTPGGDLSFIRGDNSRKVLAVTGGLTIQSEGASQFGFSFNWGDVDVDLGDLAAGLQVSSRPDRASVRVNAGSADFRWRVISAKDAPTELFGIQANPGVFVRVHREYRGGVEVFPLGPKQQASFLANGKISGVAGAMRLDPIPSSEAPRTLGATSNAAPVAPGLHIVQPLISKKAVPSGGVSQTDVLLEWRLLPSNRLVPCGIDLAADSAMQKILARYRSENMSLLLKGMRPGIYHWRVNCTIDGAAQFTPVGKIQIADGRVYGAVPQLLTPRNGQKVPGPSVDFTWERVDHSKFYVLQLSRDKKFAKFNEYLAKQGTGLRMNLKIRGNYYWRVYGVGDSKENRTGFSPTWTFSF